MLSYHSSIRNGLTGLGKRLMGQPERKIRTKRFITEYLERKEVAKRRLAEERARLEEEARAAASRLAPGRETDASQK